MALSENIHTLVLTHVPVQNLGRWDLMRWFVWLIDVMYDHWVWVYVQAEKPIKELYADKNSNSDFDEHFAWSRVESWLIEM